MACCGNFEDEFAVDLPDFDGRSAYEVSFGQYKPSGGVVRRSSDVVEVKGGGGTFFRDADGNLKTLPLVATAGAGAIALGLMFRSLRGG